MNIVVVFPAPFGPNIPTISPSFTEKEMSLTAVKLPNDLLRYCLVKGSIAVDGTSLTIFALDKASIWLSLIPHTIKNSILGYKKVGDIVNIECDMLGKYVVNLVMQKYDRAINLANKSGLEEDNNSFSDINFNLANRY